METRTAIGTNLVVGFALGLAGFAAHAARLEVDWPVLGAGLAGVVPGAWAGARLAGVPASSSCGVRSASRSSPWPRRSRSRSRSARHVPSAALSKRGRGARSRWQPPRRGRSAKAAAACELAARAV
jgi:hypothetical protein